MSYKEMARTYFTAVNNYDTSTIERMLHEDYIQHNPKVPTGRAAFLSLIPQLRESGAKIQNLRIFEDARYVIMQHLWTNAKVFGHDEMLAFHIIRFDSNDLIAEHWNLSVPSPSQSNLLDSLSPDKLEIKDKEKTFENKLLVEKQIQTLTLASNVRFRKLHKVFGEGNFVISVSEGVINNVPSAVYDLFRLEAGQVLDHWFIHQAIPTRDLANQNTLFGFKKSESTSRRESSTSSES